MKSCLTPIATAIFIGLFVIASLFPVDFWGLHHLHFLDFSQKLTVFLLVVAALLLPANSGLQISILSNLESRKSLVQLLPFVGSALLGVLIWNFPVAHDPYGDAVVFEKFLYDIATVDETVMNTLFGFSLDAWSGQKTMQAVVSLISSSLQITIDDAFRLFDLVFGVVFSFFWVYFLTLRFKSLLWILVMSLVGLAAPFMLNFFGRIEIYPPSLALLMIWVVLTLKYLQVPKLKWALMLFILNFLCIKAHPIGLLLLPSTLFVMATTVAPQLFSKLNWSNCSRYAFFPITTVGAFLYFFVFNDHVDDRSLQQATMQYDHLFLPLFSPDAPLQNYNLLSLNHIGDFLNLIFLWSPAAIFIIIVGAISGGIKATVSKHEFILIAVPFILFASLLFVINPILSMPMDWDLYSVPAPFLLVLSVFVLGDIREPVGRKLLPPIIAIAILGSSFIVLHGSKLSITERLDSVAIRVHKTYYAWTMNIIDRSDSVMVRTPEHVFDRRQKVVEQLRPNAQIGVDREFSELLRGQARFKYTVEKDFESAERIMNEAVIYDSLSGNNQIALMEINFISDDKSQAYIHSLKLVELNYPTEEQALKMAIHCALEANLYPDALMHSNRYVERWQNPVVNEVRSRLINGIEIPELKFMFRRSD